MTSTLGDPVATRPRSDDPRSSPFPEESAPELHVGLVEEPKASRAGRDLPAAIGVGLLLGALILVPLYLRRQVFVGVVVAAIVMGIREIARALEGAGFKVSQIPIVAGGGATMVLAYQRGPEAAIVGLMVTVAALLLWRLTEPGPGVIRDIGASIFTLVYVPFLAAFACMLTAPSDGPRRVTIFIATTVCSDVGGYAFGVFLGRHPMAPTISPKKSWEGFVGSVLISAGAGAIMCTTLLHTLVWQGLLVGVATAACATLGDLGESMLKRDIGIKDMGSLLPGHGGIMDRLDSLLIVAPVTWLLLSAFVPTT